MAVRSPVHLLLPVALLSLVALRATARAETPPNAAPSGRSAAQHIKNHVAHHHRRHAMMAQPIEPLQGAETPVAATAPVPNQDMTAPPDWRAPEPSFEPRIMQLQYPTLGNGYLPGSSPSAIDNEHAAKVGGIELKLPLQP